MNKRNVVIIVVVLLVITLGYFLYIGLSSGAISGDSVSGRLADILRRKEIIVGVDATYAPLEYKDDQGNFVGMDVDIAKEIAADIGVTPVFKNVPWNDLFTSIKNGSIDMSISSITITAERAQTLGFSDPYFNAGQVIVSTTSAATYLKSPADLAGLRIGAQVNTTSDIEARKYAKDPSLIYNFEEYKYAVDDLLAGRIDAIIIDYPAGVSMTAKDKRLAIMGDIFTQEFYGVATQKDQTDLLSRINKIIRRLKQDGTLKRLEDRWLSS